MAHSCRPVCVTFSSSSSTPCPQFNRFQELAGWLLRPASTGRNGPMVARSESSLCPGAPKFFWELFFDEWSWWWWSWSVEKSYVKLSGRRTSKKIFKCFHYQRSKFDYKFTASKFLACLTNFCVFNQSVNFFRHTMHSKSPGVNITEPPWNTFGEQMSSSVQQSIVTDI